MEDLVRSLVAAGGAAWSKAPAVRRLAAWSGLVGIFLISAPVLAQNASCDRGTGVSNGIVVDVSAPTTIKSPLPSQGDITIPYAPTAMSYSNAFKCGSAVIMRSEVFPTLAPINGAKYPSGGYKLYPTGIPGISFFLLVTYDLASGGSTYLSVDPGGTVVTQSGTAPFTQVGYALRLFLVVWGNLENGHYVIPNQQQIAEVKLIGAAGEVLAAPLPIYLSALDITVQDAKSCKLQSKRQAVELPNVAVGDFGDDRESTKSASFSITLSDCPALPSIKATMTDASDPMNITSTLNLAPDSTAGGVGLILYRKDSTQGGALVPVSYGVDSINSSNQRNWNFGKTSSAGASVTNDFVVKYIKKGAVVTPGSVHAESTITFSYQ